MKTKIWATARVENSKATVRIHAAGCYATDKKGKERWASQFHEVEAQDVKKAIEDIVEQYKDAMTMEAEAAAYEAYNIAKARGEIKVMASSKKEGGK